MKEKEKESKLLVTVNEAAVMLNISPHTIYNRLQAGADFPFEAEVIRIGRAIRFRKEDILTMADGRTPMVGDGG